MLGHHSSGTTAKRHLNGVSLAGRYWPTYGGIWIVSPFIHLEKKQKTKKRCQSLTPLAKLSGSAQNVQIRLSLH